MRLHYYRFPENVGPEVMREHGCDEGDDTIGGISITYAKELLKEFGGIAWTDHIERDGSVFETTEIRLAGNNSRFKYNHHL